MTKSNYGKNMLLTTSFWNGKDTIKLIPVTADAPYAEVIYDPATTLLVVISKITKNNYQFIPKLDDDGEQILAKKKKVNNKPYREQRVLMPMLQEYYITEYAEQMDFIKHFAVNADTFPISKFLRDIEKEPTLSKVESTPLMDTNGRPIKK